MSDREEIINSLNACMDVHRSGLWSSGCAFCSYAKQSNPKCFMDLTKDVIELLKHDEQTIESLERTIDKLTKAIAEKPEQKHGHWKNDKYGNTLCSVCGGLAIQTMTGCLVDRHLASYLSDYCPNCGAKMER